MKSQGNLYRESHADLAQPRIIRANITAITPIDGTFQMEVVDNDGNQYKNVRYIYSLGGTQNNFMQVPVQIGQEVFIITMSPNDQVFCLGSVYHPSFETIQHFVPTQPMNVDLSAYSKNDYVVSNYDNTLALTPSNGVIIDTDTNCRIQLGRQGRLRISSSGKAGEYALGATQFLVERKKYIDELDAKIVKMEEVLTHLTGAVSAMQAGLTAIGSTGQTPVLGAAVGGAVANSATPSANANTALTELTGLQKRTTVEHTSDCAKAINFKILIPKNESDE